MHMSVVWNDILRYNVVWKDSERGCSRNSKSSASTLLSYHYELGHLGHEIGKIKNTACALPQKKIKLCGIDRAQNSALNLCSPATRKNRNKLPAAPRSSKCGIFFEHFVFILHSVFRFATFPSRLGTSGPRRHVFWLKSQASSQTSLHPLSAPHLQVGLSSIKINNSVFQLQTILTQWTPECKVHQNTY